MRERWRNVRRAAGYRVSSEGRVRSPGGVLTPVPDKDGYLRVTLGGEKVPVHHLVLEAFAGPRPYGLEGCHGPGGHQDNSAGNLRWDTHGENIKDKLREGKADNGRCVSHPDPLVTPVTGDVQR